MAGTTLANEAGVTLTGNWQLPGVGATGTIQNTATGDNGYLSVNANTAAGSEVVEEALDATDAGQQWFRSSSDLLGYFTLRNTNSGKYLNAAGPTTLTIEGIYIIKTVVRCYVRSVLPPSFMARF